MCCNRPYHFSNSTTVSVGKTSTRIRTKVPLTSRPKRSLLGRDGPWKCIVFSVAQFLPHLLLEGGVDKLNVCTNVCKDLKFEEVEQTKSIKYSQLTSQTVLSIALPKIVTENIWLISFVELFWKKKHVKDDKRIWKDFIFACVQFSFFCILHLVHLFSFFFYFSCLCIFPFFLEIFINAISNRQQRVERQRQRETETERGKETNSKETAKEVLEMKKSERPLKILFSFWVFGARVFFIVIFSFYFFHTLLSLSFAVRSKNNHNPQQTARCESWILVNRCHVLIGDDRCILSCRDYLIVATCLWGEQLMDFVRWNHLKNNFLWNDFTECKKFWKDGQKKKLRLALSEILAQNSCFIQCFVISLITSSTLKWSRWLLWINNVTNDFAVCKRFERTSFFIFSFFHFIFKKLLLHFFSFCLFFKNNMLFEFLLQFRIDNKKQRGRDRDDQKRTEEEKEIQKRHQKKL